MLGFARFFKAPSPSGKAEVCKTSITSSNLVGASKSNQQPRMIEPVNSNSSTAAVSRGVALAVISGLAAGLVASLLDLRQAQPELDSASSIALMLLQTTGRLPLAGGLLGLLVSFLAVAGGRLASRGGRSPLNGSSLAVTVAMSPFLVYVAIRLFQGGVTSQLPARPALIAATSIAFAAVTWTSIRVTLALLARVDARRRIGPLNVRTLPKFVP